MPTITHADMESRKRMADLRGAFMDAMKPFLGQLTLPELLCVLGELTARWAGILRAEHLEDESEQPKGESV